jgi:hypothetical protein
MKDQILATVESKPLHVRQILKDKNVVGALESLGILITVFELHAPPRRAKASKGLGPTLCNYRGRRHPNLVTCKKCLAKLDGLERTE